MECRTASGLRSHESMIEQESESSPNPAPVALLLGADDAFSNTTTFHPADVSA